MVTLFMLITDWIVKIQSEAKINHVYKKYYCKQFYFYNFIFTILLLFYLADLARLITFFIRVLFPPSANMHRRYAGLAIYSDDSVTLISFVLVISNSVKTLPMEFCVYWVTMGKNSRGVEKTRRLPKPLVASNFCKKIYENVALYKIDILNGMHKGLAD